MSQAGTLFIVSTPIGDPRDITLRAIDVLRTCDLIACEEPKPARALLRRLEIDKPLHFLNEHTTGTAETDIITELEAGKNIALISDCGTPLLADPGDALVSECIARQIPVVSVPGASSVLAALVVSGFSLRQFSFIGFLPREKDRRATAVRELRTRTETLVLLEAPYRLQQVLSDLAHGLPVERRACVALDLTLAGERILRGTIGEICDYFAAHPFKGEFVIVIEGAHPARRDAKVTSHHPRRRN
ncbi:MAG: 16S rRNA (cytidine(1402)-2'-O)-methyltransferase [Bacteroidetes bacterium]|nr:16S rRNA (cytidine(1402)-2'-O)-methyltransferase [Bacteroidota bacterium]